MAKKKAEIFYYYECSLTGEKFKTTKKVSNADELVSIPAYYDLHPEMDDRPEAVKKKLNLEES